MPLKQSNYKLITAVLLVLILAVGAVCATLYAASGYGHSCSGAGCQVCLTLSVIGSCYNYVLPALLMLLAFLLALTVSSRKAVFVRPVRLTMIDLKVRLDN